jgi:hypothetical protein
MAILALSSSTSLSNNNNVHQYNIIKAFLNAIRKNSKRLYAELPAAYKKSKKCIEVLEAIYKSKDLLLL